jgi:hypothetical protein
MQKMSKHSWCGALVIIIALWCAVPMPVHAIPITPAVEYTTSSITPGFDLGPRTLGYQFSTSVPFTVNALAYFDDGLGNNHLVGIWATSAGTPLLVSTTVLSTDPVEGHFRWGSITPYLLAPGQYRIGGQSFKYLFPYDAVGVVTVDGYTWETNVQAIGAGLIYPNLSSPGAFGQNAILAVDFSIVSAVPESSTLILLASGLAGILGYGWRRKRAA